MKEKMLLDSKKFGLPGSHRLFLSKRRICSALIVDSPNNAGQSIEASYLGVLINALSLCVHSGLPGDNCRCTGL